jgi:hypothetical protein
MTPTDAALPDLLATARRLSRADKLRVIEVLVGDLAREENPPLLEAGGSYPIWTPFFAEEAAAVLLKELEKAKGTP